jgi:hypothetical protein
MFSCIASCQPVSTLVMLSAYSFTSVRWTSVRWCVSVIDSVVCMRYSAHSRARAVNCCCSCYARLHRACLQLYSSTVVTAQTAIAAGTVPATAARNVLPLHCCAEPLHYYCCCCCCNCGCRSCYCCRCYGGSCSHCCCCHCTAAHALGLESKAM